VAIYLSSCFCPPLTTIIETVKEENFIPEMAVSAAQTALCLMGKQLAHGPRKAQVAVDEPELGFQLPLVSTSIQKTFPSELYPAPVWKIHNC